MRLLLDSCIWPPAWCRAAKTAITVCNITKAPVHKAGALLCASETARDQAEEPSSCRGGTAIRKPMSAVYMPPRDERHSI